jgi:hypothetical protein
VIYTAALASSVNARAYTGIMLNASVTAAIAANIIDNDVFFDIVSSFARS